MTENAKISQRQIPQRRKPVVTHDPDSENPRDGWGGTPAGHVFRHVHPVPPSRYTGMWRDAKNRSSQMQEMRLTAWLTAVRATAYSDGEDELTWIPSWKAEWLQWAVVYPTEWSQEHILAGKRLYRVAYQVPDSEPDFKIRLELLRRFSMVVARRGLRESPELVPSIAKLERVDTYDFASDYPEYAVEPDPMPNGYLGILTDYQTFLVQRVALARTLASTDRVTEADVLRGIVARHEQALVAELQERNINAVALARSLGIGVDAGDTDQ